MRSSVGSTAFQVFDKVIAAILVLVVLYSVTMALMKRPADEIDRQGVEALLKKIDRVQKQSRHKATELKEDHLSLTVGGFHPNIAGSKPRPYIFGGQVIKKDYFEPVALVKPLKGDPQPKTRKMLLAHARAKIAIVDPKIVKVAWSNEDPGTLVFWALGAGETKVRLLLADGRVLGEIGVTVTLQVEEKPFIGAPANFAVTPGQGQAELSWSPPEVKNAKLTQYRISKGLGRENQSLHLSVAIPDPLPQPAVLHSVLANQKPGPNVNWNGVSFSVADRNIQGGVAYWYAIEAAGVDKAGKPVGAAEKAGPTTVIVPEGFEIKFRKLGPNVVAFVVSVFHKPDPAKDGQWVTHRFNRGVQRGQPVGWRVAEVVLPGGGKLLDVDFSTGYQLLDILNGERKSDKQEIKDDQGNVIRVLEQKEKEQKVLIINARGRIKVLWPSGPLTAPGIK